jgi:hypothetical protein
MLPPFADDAAADGAGAEGGAKVRENNKKQNRAE